MCCYICKVADVNNRVQTETAAPASVVRAPAPVMQAPAPVVQAVPGPTLRRSKRLREKSEPF